MRDLKSQKYPGYLKYNLFCSPAFRDLKPATRDIFTLLCYEIELVAARKKSQKYSNDLKNRDGIRLPYDEIKARLKYSHKTVWTAFNELFAHGFLEHVKAGGGGKGDVSIYSISEELRTWTTGKIIRILPVNGKVGWQKQKNKQYCSKPTTLKRGKSTQQIRPISGFPGVNRP